MVTGKARQATQILVVQCQYRGCNIPTEFSDVSHINPWVDGGATDQVNSMSRCGTHDRGKPQNHCEADATNTAASTPSQPTAPSSTR